MGEIPDHLKDKMTSIWRTMDICCSCLCETRHLYTKCIAVHIGVRLVPKACRRKLSMKRRNHEAGQNAEDTKM